MYTCRVGIMAHEARRLPPSRTEGKPEHSYGVGDEAKSLTNNTSRRD